MADTPMTCAHCGEQIATVAEPLTIPGVGRVPICAPCKPKVQQFLDTQEITLLPETSPLRRIFEEQIRMASAMAILEVVEWLTSVGAAVKFSDGEYRVLVEVPTDLIDSQTDAPAVRHTMKGDNLIDVCTALRRIVEGGSPVVPDAELQIEGEKGIGL